MWVSALLGMCTKFSEVTLAVHYREKNAEGDYVGGPMYYIKNGLGKKWYWMASVYAILGSLTVLGTGNATQVNTITTSIDSALISYNVIDDAQISMVNLVIGIVIAALVAVVLLGGVKRIGTVTEKLVPFMAVFYIILAIGVVVLNADKVPHVFEMIFVGAFNPSAFTGGVVGSMFMTMRRGVSRGIFSNEAGIGTGSIAHACADTDEPVKQGMFGIFEVFADTIVICTLTALVILCGGEGIQYGVAAGAELTISGFVTTYGSWVTIFTAIAMCCFAFSTILGWGLYGARCVEFVFTTKVVKPFMIVYALVAILGATVDLGIIWGIADTCNGLRDGLPAIPFDWALAPRLRMRGRRLQTPTLCITGLFNPRSKSYNFLVRRTSGIPNQGGKNVTYQAFEDGSGSNDSAGAPVDGSPGGICSRNH